MTQLDIIEEKIDRLLAMANAFVRLPTDPRGPVTPPPFTPTPPPVPTEGVSDNFKALAKELMDGGAQDMSGFIFRWNSGRLTAAERTYLQSINFPGSAPIRNVDVGATDHQDGAFDFSRPNSYRIVTTSSPSKVIPVPFGFSGWIGLGVGETSGNEANAVAITVATMAGVHVAGPTVVSTRPGHFKFHADGGNAYVVTLSAPEKFAVTLKLEV